MVARDLSGQQKNDTILIIGHVNQRGEIHGLTEGIARVCANKKPREILVTHPDPVSSQAIVSHYQRLQKTDEVVSKASPVSFSELPDMAELCQRIFVTLPMGEIAEADEKIIQAWNSRRNRFGTLTHLKGSLQSMGMSTDMWRDANLADYIPPEDIRSEMVRRDHNNQKVIERAVESCSFYAALRHEKEITVPVYALPGL
jgi:hypothetical protein